MFCTKHTHPTGTASFFGPRDRKYQRQHNTFKTMAANEDSMFTLHQIFMSVIYFETGLGWQVIQNQKYITSVKII